MCKTLLCLMALFLFGFGTTGVAQTAGSTLKKITAFDLPGPAGKRFDYLTIDEDDHYLISAHLAASQTYVIDVRTNKVVAVVTDTPGVEGVEALRQPVHGNLHRRDHRAAVHRRCDEGDGGRGVAPVGFAVPAIITPPASKPVTDSLNVTVKWIVAALLGSLCVAAFAIDALGFVVSSVIVFASFGSVSPHPDADRLQFPSPSISDCLNDEP